MPGALTPPLDETDHVRGRLGAPLELVMFGDFQCPYCLAAQSVLRRVHTRLGDRLAFAYRHLPITERHPIAQAAAQASEAAAAQGRFWDMHDTLFRHQDALAEADIVGYARDLGLDVDRLVDDLHQRRHALRVQRDIDSADDSGAAGTPTFFINGRHRGRSDVSTLTTALRRAVGGGVPTAVIDRRRSGAA